MQPLAVLEIAEITAYAAASALYLAYHVGFKDSIARAARTLLLVAFVLQLVDIGGHCLSGAHPLSSTPEAAAFVAWLIAAGFLAATARYRLAAAGAFSVPVILVLVLLARVLPDSPDLSHLGGLAVVHVALSTLGEACFAFAAILAALYLIQERQLKRKQFEMGRAATPLDTLDRLAARCVSIGFPIFTLAIITGALLVARMGLLRGGAAGVRFEYLLALVSWLAFGVLLVARAAADWRGRRAAWLTLGGFAGAILVLAGYFLRSAA